MKQDTFRRIVSGEKQGWVYPALRGVLQGVSILYGLGIRLRNLGYDTKLFRSYKAGVPVISIGNITTGGTGKTPLVIWLCNYLQHRGVNCGILTRGYKTRPGEMSDEPALLASACEGTTVVVNPDRIAGAKKAIYRNGAKLLVMDDGFQHRRLFRNMDIVVMDARCPFGYGRMIPAGLLREPLTSLSRASAVVITRANQVEPSVLGQLKAEIHRYAGEIPITLTAHKFTGVVCGPKKILALDDIKGKSVFAFCGIGNPDAFFDALRACPMKLVGTQVFDDHYTYSTEDMQAIANRAANAGAEAILCTQKDWVKSALLLPDKKEGPIFGYMAMELDFLDESDTIKSLIDSLMKPQND